MKNRIAQNFRNAALTLVLTFLGFWAIAQEETGGSSVSVSTTKSSNTSDSSMVVQPWMWIVGIAAFVLILIAIISAGRNRKSD